MKKKYESERRFGKKALVSLAFIFGFMFLVSAGFGVVSEYTESRPLEAFTGQNLDTYFEIQNTLTGASDMKVRASITSGGDIASLSKSEYEISAGEVQRFNVGLSVPSSASAGDEYTVTGYFEEVSEGVGGTVSFSSDIEKSFRVVVVEGSAPSDGLGVWLWIILIVVVLIVIFAVWKARK